MTQRVAPLPSTPSALPRHRPLGRRRAAICGVAFARMPNRALRFLDIALAVAAAAALITEGSLRAKDGLPPAAVVVAIASAAPLAWRTRAPLAALVGVEVGAIVCAATFGAGWSATAMVIVELYTVARLGNR